MDNLKGHAGTGSKQHPHADRGDDLYETPIVAVISLLKAEPISRAVWEPACGPGAIAYTLESAGKIVVASDIRDYGQGLVRDFLTVDPDTYGGDIVTNPPYKLAERFVRHALTGKQPRKIIMLMRLAFLESTRRSDILDGGKLARVHVFKNRLPMMHRAGWEGPKSTSATAYAWFVWDTQHNGPATINRISW